MSVFIAAGMFAGTSLYGYTTKKDLTGMGSFLFMGLIGILIASVVNIFLASSNSTVCNLSHWCSRVCGPNGL